MILSISSIYTRLPNTDTLAQHNLQISTPNGFNTMSILQPSTILQSIGFGHTAAADPATFNGKPQTIPRQLHSQNSLANLVHIVKHPVENVVDSWDTWWDGYTKEQRARKQSFDQKRQILYLRLREVSSILIPPMHCQCERLRDA